MRNFNNDRGGFKNFNDRGFGGRNRQGGFRNRNDRPMYNAVCDKCGMDCQVPFQPTGEKPVYCSNCFEKTSGRDGGNRDFGGNKRFEQRDVKDYQQDNIRSEIEAINKKLDKILDLLLNKNIDKPKEVVKVKKVKVETKE